VTYQWLVQDTKAATNVEREVVALKETSRVQKDVKKFVAYEVTTKHAITKRNSWQESTVTRRQERRQGSDWAKVTWDPGVVTTPEGSKAKGAEMGRPRITPEYSSRFEDFIAISPEP
jgi:hypothetical protein